MEERQTTTPEPMVEKLGEGGIAKELESKILAALSKYLKNGFTREETVEFLNQISQYFAVVNGLGIDNARTVVSIDQIKHDSKPPEYFCLGYCPADSDEKNGDKIAVNKTFINILSSRFIRAKNLLTASVILVGHESTHAMQGIVAQRAKENPWDISEEERNFLFENTLDPSASREGLRQVLDNLSRLKGEKLDATHYKILVSLGLYFGKTKEIDARNNGIVFCRLLYENLLKNPEIENFPEVKKWIGKQDGMIGFHEKVEGFLDKNIISKYKDFVEKCNVPNDKLVEYAISEEKLWLDANKENSNEHDETKLRKKFIIYEKTIKLALRGKSLKELEELSLSLDKETTPIIKDLVDSAIQIYKQTGKENIQTNEKNS